MGIQIGAKPDSGFDDPIGMLKDCHRRVERFLHILYVVARQARGRALTEEEVPAVQSALQYFQVAGKRHTADEEESLFPRLRAASVAGVFEELDRLEADHQVANGLHEAVDNLYSMWIAADSLTAEDDNRLQSATDQLQRIYEEHIQVEERIVYRDASKILDKQSLTAIGEEFRVRRM
jgi:hemerythrin-like domain-containing protein